MAQNLQKTIIVLIILCTPAAAQVIAVGGNITPVHLGGWHPEKFRKNFRNENITIIQYKTKRIGFIDLDTRADCTYVSNIQLSTQARGKGLGTFLMSHMELQTKQKKRGKIRLRVFKENPAKALYLRLGYHQVGDEGHSLILEKTV